jgi:hypothetical protein
MSNFTLQDAVGCVVAVIVFASALYAPGFLLGYATDLFGFRRMGAAHRSLWAIAVSFSVTPFAVYFVGKYAGLNVACGLLVGLSILFLALAWRLRGGAKWSRRDVVLAAVGVSAWVAFVVFSLADIQVGGKLYFSVVEFDQSYRVAFTDAVLRTGVPPANPLYFAGRAQPMRYYYFWYVVCAIVARIGHVSSRQAFMASSVWSGFGLVAFVGLYVRHFLGVAGNVRRQTWITVALLAVTGADLLPAAGSIFGQTALNGDMEWWSVDQVSSWQDSVLWVPHHTASLLCCMMCFLLLWMLRENGRTKHRIVALIVAGVAFASAFGLSIYVAFGFALLMLAWLARLVVGRRKDFALARSILLAGAVSLVLLAPFLRELTGTASRTDSGASARAGHVLSLSVRRMIDPQLLTGLPAFAAWNKAHPVLLDQAMRIVLLLPGLALELGFYAAVLWMLLFVRRKDEARGLALYLTGWGLVMVMFLRSAVIDSNDFGFRAALLPQFFLLLLAGDLLASWWIPGRVQVVAKTPWRRRTLYGLMALGVAGTLYQGVMLRIFLPLEAHDPANGFSSLPEQVFQARTAFAQLDRVADKSAVVEFNPADPNPGTRGDVVSPYTFYARSLMANAGRQILSAEQKCASEFGGDSGPCADIERSTASLYALPAPTAAWASEYCRRFGVQYLAAGSMDPAWSDAAGWVRTLPPVASQPEFRIVRCDGR